MRRPLIVGTLPPDACVRSLDRHEDMRGDLHELARETWPGSFSISQWNLVHSCAGVLRGMAVHLRTVDYYLNIQGRALLGLADLRSDSPGFGSGCVVELDAEALFAVTVPTGVAHGLYFVTDCLSLAGLSLVFDSGDKYGCRWDDKSLGIPWPPINPILIDRDRRWTPAAALVELIARERNSNSTAP